MFVYLHTSQAWALDLDLFNEQAVPKQTHTHPPEEEKKCSRYGQFIGS